MPKPTNKKTSFFGFGEITGIRPLAQGISAPWTAFARLFRMVPLKSLLSMPRSSGTISPGTPEERFIAEIRRSRVNQAQIEKLQWLLPLRAAIFGLASFLAWAFAISFFLGEISADIRFVSMAQNVYVILFACALTAFTLRDSLKAYQVRNIALVTFSEWVAIGWKSLFRPKLLAITDQSKKSDINGLLVLFLSTAAVVALWPHMLFAQSASPGPIDIGQSTTQLQNAYGMLNNLGPSDLSGQWLARLFPSLTGSASGDMFSTLLSSFNTILLDAGTGLAFWQGMLGIVYAAQNGSLAGSNIHVAISPLRTLFGAGALFPVVGGYCLMQVLALQILAGGYWMANTLYSDMLGLTFSPTAVAQAESSMPVGGMGDLLNNTLSGETCYAWYQANASAAVQLSLTPGNSYYQYANPGSGNLATNTAQPWDVEPASDGTNAYSYDLAECGTLSVGSAANSASTTNVSFSGGSTFDTTRNQQLMTYMQALWTSGLPQALAAQFTANGGAAVGQPAPTPPSEETYQADYKAAETAASAYLTALQGDGQALTASGLTAYSSSLNSSGQDLGWVSAGALYSAIAQMYTRSVSGIDGSIPSLTVTSLQGVSPDDRQSIQDAYSAVDAFMGSAILPTEATFSSTNGNMAPVAPTAGTSFNTESDTQRVLNEPAAGLLFRMDNTLLLDPANPMASVVSEGSFMLHSGMVIVGAAAAAKAVGGIVGSKAFGAVGAIAGGGTGMFAGAIGGVVGKVASFGVVMGEVLIFVGAFETYVIPMLFYIAWLFQIVNCIAFAAEFVLAAPLAAYQFMRINGVEPVGQEQKAFFLIAFMQGFLRPSLLIFGLAISSYVFSAIAAVLNSTFNLAIAAAQGSSIIGPVGIITYVLMLVFVQWQLCVRSIALIGRVPDAVADLVGGGLGRLSGADESALGVTGTMAPHLRGVTGSLVNVALKGGGKTSVPAGAGPNNAPKDKV